MDKYPVVILPGWLIGSARFEPLAQVFRDHGFPTFTVDFPGFETGEKLTRPLSLIDYVKFLNSFLRQKRITKAVFVVHSFGGRVALKLLSQEPQKGVALIISGTPGFQVMGPRKLIASLMAPIGKVISFVPPFIFFRKQLAQLLYRFSGTHDYYKTDGLLRATFKNIISEPLVEYMKKIRLPVLLVWGREDRIVPLRVAHKMQETIHGARLVEIEHATHNFCYKNPEKFAQPILEFLKTI